MMKVNFRSYSNNLELSSGISVIIPAFEGVMTILPFHENMVVSLKTGIIIIDNHSKYFVYDGIATIEENVIDIISDFIQDINNISVQELEIKTHQITQFMEQTQSDIELVKYRKELNYYNMCKTFLI
jgi:F0F1-type ATP synthase epsilon subunit